MPAASQAASTTLQDLLDMEMSAWTPWVIAMHRKRACQNDRSLAAELVQALRQALPAPGEDGTSAAPDLLLSLLQLHLQVSRIDPVLAQEMALQGSHSCLLQVMTMDLGGERRHAQDGDEDGDSDSDPCELLQETACEIAALYRDFPLRTAAPCTLQDVRQRLPIEFRLLQQTGFNVGRDYREETLLFHQVVTERQSAQEDVGFVLWPSAVVLARWLESNQALWTDTPGTTNTAATILELGSGIGLVGIVAAALIKDSPSIKVILSDFNKTVLENLESNIALNDLRASCSVVGLDFYQQPCPSTGQWRCMSGQPQAPVDMLLAADVICQPSDADAVARTIAAALRPGGRAYVVCASDRHRFGVQRLPEACEAVSLELRTGNVCLDKDSLMNQRLQEDLENSCGYVEGMQLQMFFITKPFLG